MSGLQCYWCGKFLAVADTEWDYQPSTGWWGGGDVPDYVPMHRDKCPHERRGAPALPAKEDDPR
jgi:hypothetical protein